MLALLIVRDGVLPAGAAETVEECHGDVIVATDDDELDDALEALTGLVGSVTCVDVGPFHPAAWAKALAPLVAHADVVVLPASPDGRDVAPHLAHRLERTLHANAVRVTADGADVVADAGLALRAVAFTDPCVVTLQPGVRSVERRRPSVAARWISVVPADVVEAAEHGGGCDGVHTVALLAADAASIDLAEAPRIVAGGAGLDSPERFDQLADVAAALGASIGTTRVVTDRGWLPHQRQIGTTGVVVDPELYMAFGISGAVQHTTGLGDPDHIISVNIDPHCPMMQVADVAIVADANEVIAELARLLAAGGERAP
ncbi:MAG: electron transfer flavoprotein subunit alpha/FixB family protein [Acidimicrobiia bacterium]|nr:electron transfer flavoprotein subunit alpha/FixB family protein [Acidimicrobiia bacterium]